MKKLALSLTTRSASILTREQLKKVMGGQMASGSGHACVGQGGDCNTAIGLDCCTKFICVEFKCRYTTYSTSGE